MSNLFICCGSFQQSWATCAAHGVLGGTLPCVGIRWDHAPIILRRMPLLLQGAGGLTLAARLSQQALLPDMMFPAIHAFNPHNSRPPAAAANGAPRSPAPWPWPYNQ